MYPPVAATTKPRETFSDDVIFSRLGSRVIAVVHRIVPSETRSFRIRPSGAAA
jgi:hypothetical protein